MRLPNDPCRVLGGTKSGYDRPLPLHLQKSIAKFRQTWGRQRPVPHRAKPSTLGSPCVCRYLLAHGHLYPALSMPLGYPLGRIIPPKPDQWYQLDVGGQPFASFFDVAEAYSYSLTLKAFDEVQTSVFMTLRV